MDADISDRLAYGGIVILFIDLEHHYSACRFGLTVADNDFKVVAVGVAYALASREYYL